jgi:phage shock protein PspC (stress-responsive transcriptional regulator)
MKDITRIHIAKVPYSIELSAKKQLEAYIDALESYTADSELLQDIEIRITELLSERGVKQEDVITSSDVVAIREQLGEPKEFMTDEATVDVDAEDLSKDAARKLYRNLDNAILGGVLSGIASYLRVNVLWVRLAFILTFFLSVGLLSLLYIVAWLIIPPARTAAEKLQMGGRTVTLASIRELNELGISANTERRIIIIKRVLTIILGITAIVVALLAIAALIIVGVQLADHRSELGELANYQLPLILMFVSGALLTILSLLVAIAAFAQKFNKRIWISGIVIICLGLTTSVAAITIGAVQQRSQYEEIKRNTVEVVEKLPVAFGDVKELSIDMAGYTNFYYVVDPAAPTIKQRMLKGAPKAKIAIENRVAKISLEESKEHTYGAEAAVTLYGPAIETMNVTNGIVSYDAGSQTKLKIEARNASRVSLAESRIDTVDVKLEGSAQFDGTQSSISSAGLFLSSQPNVSLGNIKTLTVKSPEACAANTMATLNIQNISNATFEYNGTQTASQTMKDPCFFISIGNEEMRSYEY